MARRARSPSRRLMQVTGSNVRNEHLVLSAPGCLGVDGAGEFSCEQEKKSAAGGRGVIARPGGSRDGEVFRTGMVGQARHK
jgi:hypothetical protein